MALTKVTGAGLSNVDGPVGIGIDPDTISNGKAVQVNRTVINDDDGGSLHIAQNGYYNSAWKYVENGTAEKITFASGAISFSNASSNSSGADASLSWTEHMKIDANGHVTMPNQSAFLVTKEDGGAQSFNADAATTVTWSTERFDVNGDFASNTFTAPVTGKYQLNVNLRIDVVDASADYYQIYVVTSNRTYYSLFSANGFDQDLAYMNMNISVLADMDASDTCYVQINQGGGANQSDIDGQTVTTNFSGYLAC